MKEKHAKKQTKNKHAKKQKTYTKTKYVFLFCAFNFFVLLNFFV